MWSTALSSNTGTSVARRLVLLIILFYVCRMLSLVLHFTRWFCDIKTIENREKTVMVNEMGVWPYEKFKHQKHPTFNVCLFQFVDTDCIHWTLKTKNVWNCAACAEYVRHLINCCFLEMPYQEYSPAIEFVRYVCVCASALA